MHNLLNILLYIVIYGAAILKVFAGTESGECLNNSLDTECNYPRRTSESSRARQDGGTLDDETRLRARLEIVDQLLVDEITKLNESDPTVRQVLFLHRHGDRTPIVFPPKDNIASEPFWTFHGLGQLTNRGKARLFLLGKMIRKRYNKVLGGSVNKNERVTRSSGSLRCIESAQTFLAGFLSLDSADSPDANALVWNQSQSNRLAHLWQPASVQTVPAKFDGMLAEGAECKVLLDEYMQVIDTSEEVQKINREYVKEKQVLTESLGFELDHFFKWFWASSLIEVERSYFPEKIKPEIIESFDRIEEAGNKALAAYQSTLKSKRLRQGLLISEMIQYMKSMRDNSNQLAKSTPLEPKKFVHYAAHDLTLVIMLGMLDVWQEFKTRPNYASNIAFELHQENDEWFVKVFYMEEVPSKPVEVHIKRCEDNHLKGRCTLDKFADLMAPYMIDSWQDWMKECGNELAVIDPYAPGS